jgi:hypothetical protein
LSQGKNNTLKKLFSDLNGHFVASHADSYCDGENERGGGPCA